ncbi:MAG: glycosyltransferase family 25 protein [bacterium]
MEFPEGVDQPDLRTASTDDVLAWRNRIVERAAREFTRSDVSAAIASLQQLEHATTDDRTLELTDHFLRQIADGRTVVASFDARRTPAADEVVIIYGNYPHMFGNVVVNNPIKRHVADFWSFQHDRVESDPRWDSVDQIYVINMDERRDRYDAVLRELASARAPLDRVTRVSGTRAEERTPTAGQIACLRSHIETLQSARAAQCQHVLVLEDDFCFTSDLDDHLTDLQAFLDRRDDYWICLVATSKYGPIVPRDELVSMSFQRCTNTGGHLISREGLEHLLPVFEGALERLIATGDCATYAVDRCWSVLQASEKFLVFRRKFGFQVSSYSNIEGSVSRYMD